MKKANSRREEIIKTATKILLENGHGALSIDNIARIMGISKGNLTYYFKTKELLVISLFDYLMDNLITRRTKTINKLSGNSKERLLQYINFEISLKKSSGYDIQSWETYAYSSHNKYVRRRVTEVIDLSINTLTDILLELKPELGEKECHERSVMINALLRGMMLFTGSTRAGKKHHKQLAEKTRQTAILIAESDCC